MTIIIRETGVEIEERFLIKREVLVSEGGDEQSSAEQDESRSQLIEGQACKGTGIYSR
ncbi:MAG: hypothetical protein U0223_04275 [Nitrospira sp.]